jgi:hypothetical protein
MTIPKEDFGHYKIEQVKIPKVCHRYMNIFNRCSMINGREKCTREALNLLSVCPNFALDTLREGKMFTQKAKIIQRQEYHDAMKVSSYNKGRTIANVDANKRISDGMAPNLRADSLWIDDRYADVTQQDIDAAKARFAAKQAARAEHERAHGISHGQTGHHDKSRHHAGNKIMDSLNVDQRLREESKRFGDVGKITHNTATSVQDRISDGEIDA